MVSNVLLGIVLKAHLMGYWVCIFWESNANIGLFKTFIWYDNITWIIFTQIYLLSGYYIKITHFYDLLKTFYHTINHLWKL